MKAVDKGYRTSNGNLIKAGWGLYEAARTRNRNPIFFDFSG